ncbi:hypothetical protein HXX76_014455 [Chlamydomonas incerta]|uniref:Protein kinase domain-containing protein n=1 Tax=Chlamydomonas incerta TaxID=51695 RepID=A0A835SPT0_CHLIN|nr:hypothetical protein HXX76_014455 [Chlamydomonas incerta]|eukprot:KAG2424575.1 hypothetical protein HXX76_014455 [Chlamydomonas incerta]
MPTPSWATTRRRRTWPAAAARGGQGQGQALSAALPTQERTLRALLQKAKMVLAQQSQQQQQPLTVAAHQLQLQQGAGEAGAGAGGGGLTRHLGDAELLRINKQLLEATSSLRPDTRTLLRVELLLCDARRWLAGCPGGPSPAAATALLYVAGEGLAHAEHCVRSAGQVRFWRPDGVSAFTALLQLYGDLMTQAGWVAAAAAAAAAAAPRQAQQQQRQQPLVFAAAALLLRPDWLDLLVEVLQLLHFSADYAAAAAAAGRGPQEGLAAALQLWGFLTGLVRFAAGPAEAAAPVAAALPGCMQRLAALLAPPAGVAPRLLAAPLREDTLVAQLHVLWLLQVLYDQPDGRLLYDAALAEHYVGLHHAAMTAAYEASAADPKSASAELCRIHATLLRSLARHPGQPVRAAFARARTVEWLLAQMGLESALLPQAAAAEEQEGGGGEGGGGDGSSDDDDSDLGDSSDGEAAAAAALRSPTSSSSSGGGRPGAGGNGGTGTAGDAAEGEGGTARSGAAGAGGGKDAFAFTYDLNEDVERLIALEDALGAEVALEGFEYDDEGRQLMAASEARQAAAAAASAAATPTAGSEGLFSARTDVSSAAGGVTSRGGGAGGGGGGIPRLALAGLRCASVSSMHAAGSVRSAAAGGANGHSVSGAAGGSSTAGGAGGRRLGNGASRVSHADSNWGGGLTSMGGEDDDEDYDDDWDVPLPDGDATTPTLDPAAAAERIARWSTTIAEVPPPAPSSGDGAAAAAAAAGPSVLAVAAAYSEVTGGAGATRSLPGSGPAPGVTQRSVRSDGPPAAGGVAATAGGTDPGAAPPPGLRPLGGLALGQHHPGPAGELHILPPSTSRHALLPSVAASPAAPVAATIAAAAAAAAVGGRALPPLSRPVVPPLRFAAAGDGLPPLASTSARQPPASSSRAMMLLSASNRAVGGAATGGGGGGGWPSGGSPLPPPVSVDPATRHLLQSLASVRLHAGNASAEAGGGAAAAPLIPALNLSSLRRRDGGGGGASSSSDTGRTVPLISMIRANPGSLPHGSAMDSAATPPTTAGGAATRAAGSAGPSSSGEAPPAPPPGGGGGLSSGVSGRLQRIPEGAAADGFASPRSQELAAPAAGGAAGGRASGSGTGLMLGSQSQLQQQQQQPAPGAAYQELACGRLLYTDPGTHLLLLKILMDLLVTPLGTLDAAYVTQHPADAGLGHAEYTLLWHLNAPRNAGVLHDLCRGAQRRARQAIASASASAAAVAVAAAVPPAAAAVAVAAASAVGGNSGATSSRASSARSAAAAAAAGAAGGGAAPRPAWGASAPSAGPSPTPSSTSQVVPAPVTTIVVAQAGSASARAAPAATAAAAAAAAIATAAATRPCGVTRALQLLSRPLFDAARYGNLQFVTRGAYGNIYRARMEPPAAAAADGGGGATAAGAVPAAPGEAGSSLVLAAAAAAAAGAATAGAGATAGATAAGGGAVQVVIKTLQLPGSAFDSCVLGDVFGEVAIMERFRGHECICQLLDYGMHDDAYWIVMRRYRCSLAEWRQRQRPLSDAAAIAATAASGATSAPAAGGSAAAAAATPDGVAAAAAGAAAAARVYLSALLQVVDALALLAAHNVVHFDLKCANVLIEPLPGVRDGELWAPVGAAAAAAATAGGAGGGGGGGSSSSAVPFRCVLADFGEARAYRSAAEAFTARNRGTEVFKSPEMLMLNARGGAGAAAGAGGQAAGAGGQAGQGAGKPQQQRVQALTSPTQEPGGRGSPSAARLGPESSGSLLWPGAGPHSPAGGRGAGPPPPSHANSTVSGAPDARSPSRPTSARRPQSAQAQPPPQSLAGAGLASDVWSLGCLAFELLSGSVLFGGDYASVTHRVAFGAGERLSLTEPERARLGGLPELVGLVEWILVRDPTRRPSLVAIRERVEATRDALAAVAAAGVGAAGAAGAPGQ